MREKKSKDGEVPGVVKVEMIVGYDGSNDAGSAWPTGGSQEENNKEIIDYLRSVGYKEKDGVWTNGSWKCDNCGGDNPSGFTSCKKCNLRRGLAPASGQRHRNCHPFCSNGELFAKSK